MGLIISVPILVSLLVCLMPTTIGGLLPAIGIAGMDRLLEHNVISPERQGGGGRWRCQRSSDGQNRNHNPWQPHGYRVHSR